jgi:hypothetical protein
LQFFTTAGVPMAGGLLYTYAAGTTTPLVTYTDSSGTIANTNPVILDSRGEASIWLSNVGYKFKLATAANVDIWTQDNIYSGWLTPTANLPMGGFKFTGAGVGVAATDFATYGQLQTLAGWAPTGNLPMGGFKFTGAGVGVARTDFATYGQLQDSAGTLLTAVAGTNAVTATLTNLAAYTAGQIFTLIPAGANTGAVTLNINSLGAIAVTQNSGLAFDGGEFLTGSAYQLIYDGTKFLIFNTPGKILQTLYYVDGGNSTTSTAYVNVSALFWTITPKSATSILIFTVSLQLGSASVAAANTIAYCNLYVGTPATTITSGARYTYATSGAGGVGSYATATFSFQIASGSTAARNYGVSAATNNVSSGASAQNITGMCMEIQL